MYHGHNLATFKHDMCVTYNMAFRDHLSDAINVEEEIDLYLGLTELSDFHNHLPLIIPNTNSDSGHSCAMNICQRSVVSKSMGISEKQVIDIIGESLKIHASPIEISADLAPVLQNSVEPDLTSLPIPQYFTVDAGKYMTSSIVIVEHEGIRNLSFHRMLVTGKDSVAIRIVPRHLLQIVDENRNNGKSTKIAIVNGVDPVVLIAAAVSFEFGMDELGVASALYKTGYDKNLELVKLPNGISVPADSEYAMEAEITLNDVNEGPFVDITGTVDEVRKQPEVIITKIHHRNNPIFHALLPAGAEHKTLMGMPRAPTIKEEVNKVTTCNDVHLTDGGSGWLSAVVSITPKTPSDGMNAIQAAFRGHTSMKKVTIVNDDIDITNPREVEWAVLTRSQPDRDYIILSNQKGSSLDPTRYDDGTTSKLGIDATVPHGADYSKFQRYFKG